MDSDHRVELSYAFLNFGPSALTVKGIVYLIMSRKVQLLIYCIKPVMTIKGYHIMYVI